MRTHHRTNTEATATLWGTTPTIGELEAHIERGVRLHAEAVNDMLSAAIRGAGRLVRAVIDLDQSVTPARLPAGDPSQPVKGMLGLFLPGQSWVPLEGRIVLRLVEDKRPRTPPEQGGRDSHAA